MAKDDKYKEGADMSNWKGFRPLVMRPAGTNNMMRPSHMMAKGASKEMLKGKK